MNLRDFDFTTREPGEQIRRRQDGRAVVNRIELCPVCQRPGLCFVAPGSKRWIHTMTLRVEGNEHQFEAFSACTRGTRCTCHRPPPSPGVKRIARRCPVHNCFPPEDAC